MKTRKSINYAYPGSTNAVVLGHSQAGCHYVAVSVFRDGQSWSGPSPLHNAEGFASPTDPDLLASYMEADGEPCPYFLKRGNSETLTALAVSYPAAVKVGRKSASARLAAQL